jgi:hypothetical protein
MKKLFILNKEWPDTGRTYPKDAQLEIHNIHKGLSDLVWWNGNNWQYISTIKNDN